MYNDLWCRRKFFGMEFEWKRTSIKQRNFLLCSFQNNNFASISLTYRISESILLFKLKRRHSYTMFEVIKIDFTKELFARRRSILKHLRSFLFSTAWTRSRRNNFQTAKRDAGWPARFSATIHGQKCWARYEIAGRGWSSNTSEPIPSGLGTRPPVS